ncbi:MAG: hypothetical protein ABJ056_11725 [Halioglobus sp.]
MLVSKGLQSGNLGIAVLLTPIRLFAVCVVPLLLMMFMAHAVADDNPDRDQEVMSVLDQFMKSLNQLDIVAHTDTMHFPHFRHTKGDVVVLESPEDYFPYLDLPQAQRREKLRNVLGAQWDHSEWASREIVQTSPAKVHVATTFVRFRKDGSEIGAFDSLYILTFEGGRWAIKGRSTFAPR